MKIQEIKKELEKYKDDYYRLEYLIRKNEGVKAISYDVDKSSIPGLTLNDYIVEKEILTKRMQSRIDLINKIDNDFENLILRYKYIEFNTLKEIAYHTGYSTSYIQKVFQKALFSAKNIIEIENFQFYNEKYKKSATKWYFL